MFKKSSLTLPAECGGIIEILILILYTCAKHPWLPERVFSIYCMLLVYGWTVRNMWGCLAGFCIHETAKLYKSLTRTSNFPWKTERWFSLTPRSVGQVPFRCWWRLTTKVMTAFVKSVSLLIWEMLVVRQLKGAHLALHQKKSYTVYKKVANLFC